MKLMVDNLSKGKFHRVDSYECDVSKETKSFVYFSTKDSLRYRVDKASGVVQCMESSSLRRPMKNMWVEED